MAERTALITGGAKRVGAAITRRLASEGYRVAITYLHSEGEARALVDGLNGTAADGATRAVAIRADLTRPVEAAELISREVERAFGELHVLVNNASSYKPGSLADTTVELAREMMAVHYETPLLLCQRFAAMLRQSGGHVVNMVDLLAERPWPQYMAYCASKAALANLTLSLAKDLAPEVTVNGIAPGVVEWPADYPEGEREKYLKRVPLRRAGTPADVAELVHFLVTGGRYMTGQVLRLDGGRSIT
jgi:pteridine reductase